MRERSKRAVLKKTAFDADNVLSGGYVEEKWSQSAQIRAVGVNYAAGYAANCAATVFPICSLFPAVKPFQNRAQEHALRKRSGHARPFKPQRQIRPFETGEK
jgi:hypothetical protein